MSREQELTDLLKHCYKLFESIYEGYAEGDVYPAKYDSREGMDAISDVLGEEVHDDAE